MKKDTRVCEDNHYLNYISLNGLPFAIWCQEYPEYIAYRTPLLFCDDWLNFYLDNYRMHTDVDVYSENNEISCSDYRFVYMGAKGLIIVLIYTSLLIVQS